MGPYGALPLQLIHVIKNKRPFCHIVCVVGPYGALPLQVTSITTSVVGPYSAPPLQVPLYTSVVGPYGAPPLQVTYFYITSVVRTKYSPIASIY